MKNYYAILEVPVGSSLEDIREAYRRLSQENLDNESVFLELKEAYEVLTTPGRRAEYDLNTWGESFTGDRTGQRIATQVNVAALAGMGRCPLGIDAQCPVVQAAGTLPESYCPECGFSLSSLPQDKFEAVPAIDVTRQIRLEEANGQTHRLQPGLNVVGREGTDVLLLDKTVSRQHARIEIDDFQGVTLEDLSSTNGTQVNSEALTPHIPRPLADGDQLRFGSFEVALRLPQKAALPEQEVTLRAASPPDQVSLDLARARMVQTRDAGGDSELIHFLVPGVTTFGRRAESSIVILGDPYVSGNHAQIIADGDVFRLTDVGSTNGTLLNGSRMTPNAPAILSPGDEVIIGGSVFRFERLPSADQSGTEAAAETAETEAEATENAEPAAGDILNTLPEES